MAQRFVRIDLSGTNGDFRPVAIEPGLPLLDTPGGNGRIVSRWLGRLAGLPEWQGQSVGFFVQDDQGGRLEEIYCQPATRADLQEFLADELQILQRRIDAIRPETPSERELAAALQRSFRELAQDASRTDLDDYFFRYRDVHGHWRLVWCWGYTRTDQELAPAVICSDTDCCLLFLRRPHGRHKCPSCQAALAAAPPNPSRWKRLALLALLLLLLLGGLWWLARPLPPPQAEVSIRVGESVDPPLKPARSQWQEVSSRDPAVVEIRDGRLVARAEGNTVVELRDGRRSALVHVRVLPGVSESTGIDQKKEPFTEEKKEPVPVATAPAGATGLQAQTAPSPAQVVETAIPDRPRAVRILSDQGPAVSVPVGGQFEDFRVEAEYADGMTRLVTRKAILRIPQAPAEAPLAAEAGRLTGLSVGRTTVTAEFEGVRSAAGLEVSVLDQIRADEIRLRPAALVMQPGESIALAAIGYKGGKSFGSLSDLPGLTLQSSDPQVARTDGKLVTALATGRARVTAALGSLSSVPVEIEVTATVAQSLRVDPERTHIQVGERLEVGRDLQVWRGDLEVSRECSVVTASPDVLRFDPAACSLVGLSPGASPVAFGFGDKAVYALVEVLPAEARAEVAEVVIEPASARLVPGQAVGMRVFALSASGQRVDRTSAATLRSSDPNVVSMHGSVAYGLTPGRVQITAALPDCEKAVRAVLEVREGKIRELRLEPPRLDLGVGDRVAVRVLGVSDLGTYELFPQRKLAVTVGGPSPRSVQVDELHQLEAISPGQAAVTFRFDDLKSTLPVEVQRDAYRDLRIEPPDAVIRPGDALSYQVSASRNGQRYLLPPERVQLSVGDSRVAAVEKGMVRGLRPGKTAVRAKIEGQQAEATLRVARDAPAQLVQEYDRLVVRPDRVVTWGQRRTSVLSVPELTGLSIEPGKVALEVGQQTPPLRAMARDATGRAMEVPAELKSLDPDVLASAGGGRFAARRVGSAQVRAHYGGQEAFADVTISGARFLSITSRLEEGGETFRVNLEVLAARSEGALEYRVYVPGQKPPESWQAAQDAGKHRRVVLQSSPIRYGDRTARYQLLIEARDPSGKSLQQYPFSFRLAPSIERTDPRGVEVKSGNP